VGFSELQYQGVTVVPRCRSGEGQESCADRAHSATTPTGTSIRGKMRLLGSSLELLRFLRLFGVLQLLGSFRVIRDIRVIRIVSTATPTNTGMNGIMGYL
jgi:hypothetical protein